MVGTALWSELHKVGQVGLQIGIVLLGAVPASCSRNDIPTESHCIEVEGIIHDNAVGHATGRRTPNDADPREPSVARSHETSSHIAGTMIVSLRGGLAYPFVMTTTLIGYARCSTDKQDLAAQKAALEKLGVAPERIYTDRGLTGTNRSRPGLDQALAAVRTGDRSWCAASSSRSGRASMTRLIRWGKCSSTSWPPSPSSRLT